MSSGSTQRRTHSTNGSNNNKPNTKLNGSSAASTTSTSVPSHDHSHSHSHNNDAAATTGDVDHSHSHSHSMFSLHSHTHSHDEIGTAGADQIVNAFKSTGDRGSRVTLIGLFCNVILTGAKGAAGFYMHSASLTADAAHSLSDLLGDFVTLFCYNLSRKAPTQKYPYGFAKFETLGTTTVSILLIGGALGIGFHSCHLLGHALGETAAALDAGSALKIVLDNATAMTEHIPQVGHTHGHGGHGTAGVLDPNAAWFAAVSVIVKEWLYRITKRVADEEHSPVLLANAVHHRSDAYSSVVALVAILGSSFFPHLPLDPLGGLLVSIVIFQQGLSILGGAYRDLTDAGVSDKTRQSLIASLDPLLSSPTSHSSSTNSHIIAISHLRARWSGSLMFVDLTADVSSGMNVKESAEAEESIMRTLKEKRREVTDVRVRFRPVV